MPTRKVFGDKASFAIEYELKRDPDNDRWAGSDEIGSYGFFNMFIAGQSVFRYRYYDMADDDTVRHGYRILDTFTEYPGGREDHLIPIIWWLEYVCDVVSAPSKTRFKRLELPSSPYGTIGNIYPNIGVKRSANDVFVYVEQDRSTFYFKRHIEYVVNARIKMRAELFLTILNAMLDAWTTDYAEARQEASAVILEKGFTV